ncbi:unnamed protein product [Chondrus crispus]|uniref:Helicase C-terminal domain-containing protein n=1 Tax=Chondrus crispus TaxID=2769 RepID=R7QBM6_CHOCR|nr:unnamed protein product [Chondrus crispus]CDF34865.1 unnamed protein product [Chondrus crispus]|eukprot:XP_005714684.1 unnamed protein product [Chondrus crispus]
MRLEPDLLRGIYSAGYYAPSLIQQHCVMPLIRKRDVIAQAQSGTGKTSLIAFGSLQIASPDSQAVQVHILSPIRYLSKQTEEKWKFETLCDLYEMLTITQAVIFCNKKRNVEWLTKKMVENGFTVMSMSGSMTQERRNEVMDSFRKGHSQVLIATDIWSRGIDVQQVSLVINYDVLNEQESYLHGICRSGKFGRKGVAITFVTSGDMGALRSIERIYAMQTLKLPSNVGDYLYASQTSLLASVCKI